MGLLRWHGHVMTPLAQSPTVTLSALRDHLRHTGRWPIDDLAARRLAVSDALRAQLTTIAGTASQIVAVLDIVLHERREREREVDAVDLVWSGPEVGSTETRETAVVLRELFLGAKRRVTVATYVLANGAAVFGDLAHRLDAEPDLEVRFLLNARLPQNEDLDPVPATRTHFIENWPGVRRPRLFIDPRTAAGPQGKRTTMHAKFVVVDEEVVFLTSANFTEAAQDRNVEAGLLVRRATLASRLERHVDGLIQTGLFRELQGI
jgi:phosphatidylserine/phosphatidylglycerophosphate/cardiolipin synthase-like enzyme